MMSKLTWALGLSLLAGCAAPRTTTFDATPARFAALEQHAADGNGHHQNHASLFLGFVNKDDHGHNETAFATGVEIEHRIDDMFGVGIVAEVGSHPFNSSTLAAGVFAHPIENLTLLIAPGVENESTHINFMTRFGASYGFDIGNGVTLSPGLYYDVVEHAENGLVFGLSFGVGF